MVLAAMHALCISLSQQVARERKAEFKRKLTATRHAKDIGMLQGKGLHPHANLQEKHLLPKEGPFKHMPFILSSATDSGGH